ncbi:hypothetical protein [Devosia sp.]|uniref:hypothetical protein n=1 Tax=Devosia sp. TaxID=1871048 RepID=UPI001ACB01FB|nr:hypothetical protein [Devosia sp.]MBN9335192.1 hypothetical protein [Devosia sp.]
MVNKQDPHHTSGHQIVGRAARDPKTRWRSPSPQEVLIFRTAVDECALRLVTDTDAQYEAMRQRFIDMGVLPPSKRAFVRAVLDARYRYGPRLLGEAIQRRRRQGQSITVLEGTTPFASAKTPSSRTAKPLS